MNNTLIGLKVSVYFNLHKHVWSVKALEGEHKGRVVHHTDHIILKDAVQKVSEAGRQRVLREQVKNVHASIVGTISGLESCEGCIATLYYNPYTTPRFVYKESGKEFLYSPYVEMIAEGRLVKAYPEDS